MFTADLLTEVSQPPKLVPAVSAPGVTPTQIEGPFYPINHLPVDQIKVGTDLVFLDGQVEKAQGDVVVIEGVVMDESAQTIPGVLVEIWQACASGRYNHAEDPNPAPLDSNFQYWGKAITDANGFYCFRTIIPGSYPAEEGWTRPAHIHFKVTHHRYKELITQMYFKHDPLNAVDQILQKLDLAEQERLIVEFINRIDQKHPVGQFNIQLEQRAN